MVTEAKPFASLSSGHLARKGAARPAMRPQGFGQVGNGLEDLGWNDMGFEPPKPAAADRDADHEGQDDGEERRRDVQEALAGSPHQAALPVVSSRPPVIARPSSRSSPTPT